MTANTLLMPVTAPERIDSLDVLRGWALLGIALMNVEYFSTSLLDVSEGIDPALRGLDWLADAFVYVFVTGKFWTLFSLLFGMGFAVMLGRAHAAGRGFVALYLRRTLGLLLIGLVHGWLIWAGDILVSYALTALALLAWFRNTPTRQLWKWGGGLWLAMLGMTGLGALAMIALGDAAQTPHAAENAAALAALRTAEVSAYSAGSYAAATAVRVRYFFSHALPANLFLAPLVLGMFLVGAWLVRNGAIVRPDQNRRMWRWLAWLGGSTGLALTALGLAVDPHLVGPRLSGETMLAMTLHSAGAPLMALAYVAVAVLALQRGANWLRMPAPVGRMALSNYLAQSVIGTLVFYGYGLGLWGEVSRAGQVLGVVVVFAVQLALSRWWLVRFRFGPLEWLWRAFTYWQWPPLRRGA